MRTLFCFLTFMVGPALAQTPDARTPEQMTVEAYGRLMSSPGQVDRRFWNPERWYARDTLMWIADYERCHRRSPPIWYNGQGQPKLTNVDITPVPASGNDAQVLVSLKDLERPEQRIFFFLRENGAWRIKNVMASGGGSLNVGRPACR